MLFALIAVLFLVWLVAVVLKFTVGGLVHILLLVAAGLLAFRFVAGAA